MSEAIRDDAMRLTIDISRDPEHPTTWVATCLELGVRSVVSAARTPQDALAALGSAVRMVVAGIVEKRGTPGAGLDVLREIVAGYAAMGREELRKAALPPLVAKPPDLLGRINNLCAETSEARALLTHLDMQLAELREELQSTARRVRVTREGTHGWDGTVVGSPGSGLLIVRRDDDGVSFTVGEHQIADLSPEPKP